MGWLLDLTTDGGIRATRNLAEGGKKGSVVDRGVACEECRDERRNSRVRGRIERKNNEF
jgi:hypothetical protein